MNVTIINAGTHEVPVVLGNSGGERLALVAPGASHQIDDENIVVVSIGDNPSFLEEVAEDVSNIVERLKFWRDHRPKPKGVAEAISVTIVNRDLEHSLRVMMDSNVNEAFIGPVSQDEATAERYVEVREQGV